METEIATKFKDTDTEAIPKEWTVLNVGKIGRVVTGKTPPTNNPEYYGNDYPFVKIPDMTDSVYINKTNTRISQKGADYLGKAKIPKNSIMVSCIATIGNVGITSEDSFTNQQINSLIPNKDIADFKYLYYFFKSNKELLESLGGGGSVYTNISKSKFENMPVVLPGLPEQKIISEILSSLDDKIELNHKINSNFERIASLIFKKWFIDIDDNSSQRLETRTLNDEIQESVNGDWGKEHEDYEFTKKVFCIRGADITDLKRGGTGKMPVRFIKEKNFINRGLRNGDIVVEISGGSPTQSTGRSVLITNELLSRFEHPLICSNFCKVIRFKETNHAGFYYTLFNEIYNRDEFFQYENGTSGIKNLDLTSFFETTDFYALDKKMSEFSLFVSNLYKNIQENGAQNNYLSTARDSILTRLMNGKIRVTI